MPTLQTHNGYPLWRYIPSLPAAIVFAAVFGVLTIAHTWRMFRHRMWFCIPFVVGGLFEIIGYVGRAAAYNSTGALMPYVLQSTFLLLAPVLFAASLYMTLSRIIRAVDGASFSIIRPTWLTRIFVAGDAFSFLVQASGAGLRVQAGTGNSTMNPNLGTYVIVGGLIFQIAIFGVFMAVALVFNQRFKRHAGSSISHGVPWQSSLNMLYVTSAMIMIRNIFRVAEYAMGHDGYLLGVEWGVYVFDAALMTITMAWFFWRYPSQLKPALKAQSYGQQPGRGVLGSSDDLDIGG
ncbi:RTA1 like protein-domain-containing protein [Plectosphaerella plurivora]|uniref:RTA1 like protein-domain-containing protein n=1 Tax=Plectosphaerella plurivora TaxID=936078 RepID=A0A9P8V4E5_9PEZI|nr:RTA1 like protein-domain-containing protein [Plectosphaerella plurivora]